MIGGAGARRGHGELVGFLARKLDELLHRLRRHRRMHLQHDGRERDHRDRHEVLPPFVGGTAGHGRRKQDRPVGAEQESVAVGIGLRDRLAADQPTRAGAILHHKRLAKLRLQLVGDDARRAVHVPAGRIRHDDLHGAIRPFLRRGRHCKSKTESGAEGGHKFHDVPPSGVLSLLHQAKPNSRAGLSTRIFRRISSSSTARKRNSMRSASLGGCLTDTGCGQSLPQITRSGAAST
jgi:hypothetical protein